MTDRLISKSFLALVAAHFLNSMGWTSMLLLPLYLDFIGASRAQIGLIIAMARIGGLLLRPAVGWALDTFGRRPTIVVGTFMLVLGMLMIWPVTSVGPMIYAARIVFGIGVGATFAGYFTFAADVIPESRRTEGLALFGVSGLLPMAIAPLGEQLGIATPDLRWYYVVMALPVLISLVVFWYVPDHSKKHQIEPISLARVARAATQPALRSVWLATFVFSAMVILFMAFASVTAEARGLATPSVLWITYSLGAVGARVFGAKLPDKLGTHNMVAPTIGIYVIAAQVIAFATTPTAFMFAGLLAGLAHGYCFPVLASQAITRMPDRFRGSAMSMFTFIWDFTALVASPLFGLLADATNDAMMYLTASMVAVIVLIAWGFLEHRR